MAQLSFESILNKNLFSDYYLENLIQKNSEWGKKEHEEAFQRIKIIYNAEKPFFAGLNEPQLEKRFFRRVFKIILPEYEVQEPTEEQDLPDYAFFPNMETLDNAHQNKGTKSFYVEAFAIGEVKRWDVELDKFGRNKYNKRRNPSFQIWLYLHEAEPKWGILSNGRKWRLYHQDRPLDSYFEVDLITLLETDDIEGFKYFYYFFRKEAFLPAEDGTIFLERVRKGSLDYAQEIGDNLKENVYRAMKQIADGFFNWPQNGLDPTDDSIRLEVQKSAMRLLYRFLFLLYAEGKGLLSLKEEHYRNTYSFDRLKKEVQNKKDGPSQHYYSPATTTLWSRLKDLFRLIEQGSEAFDIPNTHFFVPAYNGGLFDPERNPNLEEWTIGDTYLADAIDLLARSDTDEDGKGFVDYSTLEIRHLGSIYEGLLEYKLNIAEHDMVVRGRGDKREWVTLEGFNEERTNKKSFDDFDEFDRVRAGEIYLATDKGERKVTGSYYTPDYIVNYIVGNTVGPVVEEMWKEASKNGENLIDATLSVQVLDPAIGSGHFLVGAVEFLAGKLLEAAQKDIEAGLVEDDGHFTPDWAKREVVSHCIYGVDLNDLAVELAKVSLWLTTISKDKPLSFLDHRLKQGNSLIGTYLEDLSWHPSIEMDEKQRRLDIPEGFIKKIVDMVGEIVSIADDTLANIRIKEEIFERLKKTREYDMIKTLADIKTSIYFGNEIDKVTYGGYTRDVYSGSGSEWLAKRENGFAKKAKEIAEEKRFFHWELEFPEIFFEKGKLKDNPGFDAVVGNPPYIDSEEMTRSQSEVREYINNVGYKAASGNWDIFCIFIERELFLSRKGGQVGKIIPNKLLAAEYALETQRIIGKYLLKELRDYSRVKVFEISVYPIVIVVHKISPKESDIIQVEVMKEKAGDKPELSLENQVTVETFRKLPEGLWSPLVRKDFSIVQRILKISDFLSQHGEIVGAATVSEAYKIKEILEDQPTGEFGRDYLPFINTGTIDRYDVLWGIRPTRYIKKTISKPIVRLDNLRSISEKRLSESKSQKIIIAGMTLRLEAIYDPGYFLAGKSTVLVLTKDLNLKFLTTCINSKLISFMYRELFESLSLQGGYLRIGPPQISRIHIRRINFTTSPDRLVTLVEEAKLLYQEYLITKNYIPLLDFVDERLPKDKEGEFITEDEESDVIHDLLVFLAEQMMGMNNEKNREIKGFIVWFEREIDTEIETLTNKTKLMKYHDLNFDEFFGILKKNKKKIKINMSVRSFQDNLKREFEKSIAVIAPLRKKINATDQLIDQIVYKLYGLTDDEIKKVEESI